MGEITKSRDIAMKVSMDYEKEQGRRPVNVSGIQGMGYDVESTGEEEERHIEVKGRGEPDPPHVFLDDSQYQNALNDPQFWLYIVLGTDMESPDLIRIKGKNIEGVPGRQIKWKLPITKHVRTLGEP